MIHAFRAFGIALRDTWLSLREVAIITPLRMITGRRQPNYLRIAQLESEIYGTGETYPARLHPGEMVITGPIAQMVMERARAEHALFRRGAS
jgi:hypothetical protein